jgi:hypothetical protein
MTCWCAGNCPNVERPRALIDAGRLPAAELALKETLSDAPGCYRAHELMAGLLAQTNRASFADSHLSAGSVDPDRLRFNIVAGYVYRSQTNVPRALEAFGTAVAVDARSSEAWAGLIGATEALGELDQAERLCVDAAKHCEPSWQLRRITALVESRCGRHGEAIRTLSGPNITPLELFDRGRYREAMADYAGAWGDWMTAKRLLRERAGYRFDQARVEALVHGTREVLAGRRWRELVARAAPELAGPQPIFVLGFPRSGTTLTEQIISAHPDVAAGDEMQFVLELAGLVPRLVRAREPYPGALLSLTLADNTDLASIMAAYYLTKARSRVAATRRAPYARFTDKMPLNEMYLPLVRLMFPRAAAVYVRRHPLDALVSNMSHLITHGHHYASELGACATMYALNDSLLAYVSRRLDELAPVDLAYESLVSDQAMTTRALVSACGLDDAPACYEPHKNPRHARTISYNQVTQPISDKAIGRYVPFLRYLAPVLDTLAPAMKRMGYEA